MQQKTPVARDPWAETEPAIYITARSLKMMLVAAILVTVIASSGITAAVMAALGRDSTTTPAGI